MTGDEVLTILRRRLDALGKTQAPIAQALGVTQGEASKILSGKRVLTFDHFMTLCTALGVNPAALIGSPIDANGVDLLANWQSLDPKNRQAVADLARALVDPPQTSHGGTTAG